MRHIKEDPLQIKFKEKLWNYNIDSVLYLLCFMHNIEQSCVSYFRKKNRILFRVLIFCKT